MKKLDVDQQVRCEYSGELDDQNPSPNRQQQRARLGRLLNCKIGFLGFHYCGIHSEVDTLHCTIVCK